MLTKHEETILTPEELIDYDAMVPDEKSIFATAFRRGRRGRSNPERYSRKRSELAVEIATREQIGYDAALAKADERLAQGRA